MSSNFIDMVFDNVDFGTGHTPEYMCGCKRSAPVNLCEEVEVARLTSCSHRESWYEFDCPSTYYGNSLVLSCEMVEESTCDEE